MDTLQKSEEEKILQQIPIQLTEKDFWNFHAFAASHARGKSILYIALCVGLSLIVAGSLIEITRESNILGRDQTLNTAVFVLVTAICLSLFIRFFGAFLKERNFHPDGNLLSPKTLSIDPMGIAAKNEISQSFTKWEGIYKISDNDHGIYFFIDKMQAYILPKASFPSPEEAQNFLDQATQYWRLIKRQTEDADNIAQKTEQTHAPDPV